MTSRETWRHVREKTIERIAEALHRARSLGHPESVVRLSELLDIARTEPPTRSLPKGLDLHWSYNPKLQRTGNAVSFSLPAFESITGFRVCPGAGAGCRWWCYACNSRYETPRVVMPREFNLAIVRRSIAQFIEVAVNDLARIPHRIIRIHDSGDFFSARYLAAWQQIARRLEGAKTFYAFTKSLDLDLWRDAPSNLTIVQSELGSFDDRIDWSRATARMFESHEQRVAAGYIDATHDDWPALLGEQWIGHVYHGPKGARRLAKLSALLQSQASRRPLPIATPG